MGPKYGYITLLVIMALILLALLWQKPYRRKAVGWTFLLGSVAALATQDVLGKEIWDPHYSLVSWDWLGWKLGIEDLLFGGLFSATTVAAIPGKIRSDGTVKLSVLSALVSGTALFAGFRVLHTFAGNGSIAYLVVVVVVIVSDAITSVERWQSKLAGAVWGLGLSFTLVAIMHSLFGGTSAWGLIHNGTLFVLCGTLTGSLVAVLVPRLFDPKRRQA